MAIFANIYFFASFPQRTVLVIVGTTNPIQTINAICIPENEGSISMRNARVIIISRLAMNSMVISFHMPSIIFFISSSEYFLSPWWIFIQSFPKSGPCQKAPPKNVTRVMMMIASQLSEISIVKWSEKIRSLLVISNECTLPRPETRTACWTKYIFRALLWSYKSW